jgi:hypothetical protein
MTKQDQQQFEEELSDILLIMDKNDEKVYGMKGVGKYDEFETAEVKNKNQEQFKRFYKDSDFFSSFMFEFFSKMENPTRYLFFIVPQSKAVELAEKIQKSVNNPSKEGGLLLKKYELQTEHLQESLKSEQKKSNSKKQQEMPKAPAKSKGRKM